MRTLFCVLLAAGCGTQPAPSCPPLPADCTPQYTPDFESVFTNTLQRSCGVGGNSCHATGPSPAGGLVLDNIDTAHDELVLTDRVQPGDAACSTLIQRLNGSSGSLMPPGAKLSDAEICAVRQWIEAGAQR